MTSKLKHTKTRIIMMLQDKLINKCICFRMHKDIIESTNTSQILDLSYNNVYKIEC